MDIEDREDPLRLEGPIDDRLPQQQWRSRLSRWTEPIRVRIEKPVETCTCDSGVLFWEERNGPEVLYFRAGLSHSSQGLWNGPPGRYDND